EPPPRTCCTGKAHARSGTTRGAATRTRPAVNRYRRSSPRSRCADPQGLWIVGWRELRQRWHPVARDLDLPAAGRHERVRDTLDVGDVAEAYRPTEGVAVGARGDSAHEGAVPPDRLVVIQKRFRIFQREHGQPPAQRFVAQRAERLAADERRRLVETDREAEARFPRRVLGAEVVAPGPIRFLDA